eukprot:TRINITY_DN65690_c0_g1_i1.p1 TRINITY_DN65690_c0_g1~~TRINITY_DN65690_c0_g1_i1.p1  ORF type:complete len:657 (-),score=146.11 TRINITY_DN65690_c0_g1_i1:313-2283(-)
MPKSGKAPPPGWLAARVKSAGPRQKLPESTRWADKVQDRPAVSLAYQSSDDEYDDRGHLQQELAVDSAGVADEDEDLDYPPPKRSEPLKPQKLKPAAETNPVKESNQKEVVRDMPTPVMVMEVPEKPVPVVQDEAVSEEASQTSESSSEKRRAQMKARKSGAKTVAFNVNTAPAWKVKLHNIISWWVFDAVIGVVIFANGGLIGLETHYNVKLPIGCDADCKCKDASVVSQCSVLPAWVVGVDYSFFVIYSVELGLRLLCYGLPVFASGWVRFDAFLVASSFFDIVLKQVNIENEVLNQLMLVRMMRLARLARAVRLMSQFATLWSLVQGIMYSVETLAWTFFLVMILIYIFAVFGMEFITFDDELPADHPYNVNAMDNFNDLGAAIMTLLQFFSFDSIAAIYRPLIKNNLAIFFYVMTVLLLLSIALANLVTAILVDSSMEQANADKDTMKMLEAQKKAKQMEQLKVMFEELDEDGSGQLTIEELDAAPPNVLEQLIEIAGTDDIHALFEMLDYDGGGEVSTDEFCEGVMKATNSEKPMELSRLVKQCSEILRNSKEAIDILRPEDAEGEDGEDGEPKKPPEPPKEAEKNKRVEDLEYTVDTMEQSVSQISLQVSQMLKLIEKTGLPNQGGGADEHVVKKTRSHSQKRKSNKTGA